jgi:hypothetical protein
MTEYLTARDVEDLVARGIREISVHDGLILTDLARDRAVTLGVSLLHKNGNEPSSVSRVVGTIPSMAPMIKGSYQAQTLPQKPQACMGSHPMIVTESSTAHARQTNVPQGMPESRTLTERLVDTVRRLNRL